MCSLYSLGACGTGHVCARKFSQTFWWCWPSLLLLFAKFLCVFKFGTTSRHCWHIALHWAPALLELATKTAGKFPTGFRAHSLSHVSISSIRRRESGIDRRHHQSREPPPPPESALCHTQRTPSPSRSHQMTLRSWVPGRTNSFPNKSVQFSAQQCNPPSLGGYFAPCSSKKWYQLVCHIGFHSHSVAIWRVLKNFG